MICCQNTQNSAYHLVFDFCFLFYSLFFVVVVVESNELTGSVDPYICGLRTFNLTDFWSDCKENDDDDNDDNSETSTTASSSISNNSQQQQQQQSPEIVCPCCTNCF